MKRLISLFVIMCMLIASVPVFAEEADSGDEYYIDVELKYYTSDRLSPIFLPMKTNCPEITFEIYYPDGKLYHKHTISSNWWKDGSYADYCNYYHYDGDYLLVFSYEDCRTEIVYTIENSDRYKAWFERTYGFKPEEKEPESTEQSNKGSGGLKVDIIEVSENEVELYTQDTKEITVTSSTALNIEIENEDVVEANLTNGILAVKALKMGKSEIWIKNSTTYTPVSVTVLYGTNPEKEGLYSDVSSDSDYAKAVKALTMLGIMEGYEDGTFKPEGTLSRAEAAVIMVRTLKLERYADNNEKIFTDIESTHWANKYINSCVANGIVNGKDDGTFAPDENVTYHQLVKMVVCMLGYEPMAAAHGGWQGLGYIFTGANIGLTKGIPETVDENITRGKTAQILYNALKIDLMDEVEIKDENASKKHKILEGKNILTEYWEINSFDELLK